MQTLTNRQVSENMTMEVMLMIPLKYWPNTNGEESGIWNSIVRLMMDGQDIEPEQEAFLVERCASIQQTASSQG